MIPVLRIPDTESEFLRGNEDIVLGVLCSNNKIILDEVPHGANGWHKFTLGHAAHVTRDVIIANTQISCQ